MNPLPLALAPAEASGADRPPGVPASRRRRRRHRRAAGWLFSLCMMLVWPVLFALPAAGFVLSWWLRVL